MLELRDREVERNRELAEQPGRALEETLGFVGFTALGGETRAEPRRVRLNDLGERPGGSASTICEEALGRAAWSSSSKAR